MCKCSLNAGYSEHYICITTRSDYDTFPNFYTFNIILIIISIYYFLCAMYHMHMCACVSHCNLEKYYISSYTNEKLARMRIK